MVFRFFSDGRHPEQLDIPIEPIDSHRINSYNRIHRRISPTPKQSQEFTFCHTETALDKSNRNANCHCESRAMHYSRRINVPQK